MSVEGSGKRMEIWQAARMVLRFSIQNRAYLKKTRIARLFTMLTRSQVLRLQKNAPSVIKRRMRVAIAMVGRSVAGPKKIRPRALKVAIPVIRKASFIVGFLN